MNLSIPNKKIECKSCKKIKQSKEFRWRKKDNGLTLDSRTCIVCYGVDKAAVYLLKKSNPAPKNNKCQCCGKVSKLNCDHSHTKSKSFRGYLCSKCNVGIGNLGDNLHGLLNAIKYLTKNTNEEAKVKVINKLKTKLSV